MGGLYELMNKLSQTNNVNGKILIRIFLFNIFLLFVLETKKNYDKFFRKEWIVYKELFYFEV